MRLCVDHSGHDLDLIGARRGDHAPSVTVHDLSPSESRLAARVQAPLHGLLQRADRVVLMARVPGLDLSRTGHDERLTECGARRTVSGAADDLAFDIAVQSRVLIGPWAGLRLVLDQLVPAAVGDLLVSHGQGRTADTIFGYRAHWSLGAKTSAAPTSTPTGNPLLIFCNPMYLLLGVRSGPESVFIDGRNGLAALTDESILKMRSRRAFAPGMEQAFSILETRP